MSRFRTFCLAALGTCVLSGAVNAATLTFDTVADCSGADVTITGGAAAGACTVQTAPGGSSGLLRSTIGNPGDSFWTANFASLVNTVSIDLGD